MKREIDDNCTHNCACCSTLSDVLPLAVLGAWYLRLQTHSAEDGYESLRDAFRHAAQQMLAETPDGMTYATPQIAATVAALTQTALTEEERNR